MLQLQEFYEIKLIKEGSCPRRNTYTTPSTIGKVDDVEPPDLSHTPVVSFGPQLFDGVEVLEVLDAARVEVVDAARGSTIRSGTNTLMTDSILPITPD
jgi:hypothetical protein